jgi:hypothetical protein
LRGLPSLKEGVAKRTNEKMRIAGDSDEWEVPNDT